MGLTCKPFGTAILVLLAAIWVEAREMIFLKKQIDRWMIVKAEKVPRTKPDTDTSQEVAFSQRTIFTFWTGEKWAGQNVFAKLFDTEAEARAYLEENQESLEK